MAEAAGLAIGVAALALTLQDCLDLYSYISSGLSLDRDLEILTTKLDIEKLVLLGWAESIRLANESFDQRLEKEEKRSTLEKVLLCIRRLLSESNALELRYGLEKVEDGSWVPNKPIVSEDVTKRFIHDFENLKIRITQKHRASKSRKVNDLPWEKANASAWKRVRWAIRDNKKFRDLIEELAYFNSKLYQLMAPSSEPTAEINSWDNLPGNFEQDFITEQEVEMHVKGIRSSGADAAKAKRESQVGLVLGGLWFRTMNDRQEVVKAVHSKTFEWSFSTDPEVTEHIEANWDSLPDWLGDDKNSGLYWVTGKAGSGKSTLMKHVAHHKETQNSLINWANGRSMLIKTFFFWFAGLPEQRSLQGLWRALLYKILHRRTELIPKLLPNLWREVINSDELTTSSLMLPTTAEVQKAFQTLETLKSECFCFFIDGLDEYSGDQSDAISLITTLSSSPNVKVVVSSRPIPSCVQASFKEQKEDDRKRCFNS
ncbi:hypothetical protein PG990_010983 [Apiospora arundinis]